MFFDDIFPWNWIFTRIGCKITIFLGHTQINLHFSIYFELNIRINARRTPASTGERSAVEILIFETRNGKNKEGWNPKVTSPQLSERDIRYSCIRSCMTTLAE